MSLADIRVALVALPQGSEAALSVAYDQAMQRIEAQKQGVSDLGRRALTWVTYAKRLLTVKELRHALGVQHRTSDFDEECLCDIEDIVSACGGLVIVDQGQGEDPDQTENTVRLVHYSTQDFLRDSGDRYLPNAQRNIATNCLTYLLYDTFREGWLYGPTCIGRQRDYTSYPRRAYRHQWHLLLEDEPGDENQWLCARNRIQQYPFILYAAQHWATHASTCPEQSIRELVLKFLGDQHRVSSATQVLISPLPEMQRLWNRKNLKLYPVSRHLAPDPVSGMHLTCYYGIESLVLMLLRDGFAPDLKDASDRSPLFWASVKGHTAVVELLLSLNSTEVDPKSKTERSLSLSDLTRSQHKTITFFSADVVNRGDPVSQAAKIEDLADLRDPPTSSTVDVNCQDNDGDTPLMVAAEGGHLGVVARLLESSNISVNIGNDYRQTALIYAIQEGYEGIVRLLVAHADIDVNLKISGGAAALTWAVYYQYEEIVRFLLSIADIDVNTECDEGTTPLLVAVRWEYDTAELLLAHHGIDVNYKNKDGKTALGEAVKRRKEHMVELLLQSPGVNVSPVDSYGNTPLFYVAYGWYKW